LLKNHKIGKVDGKEGGSTFKCNAKTKGVMQDYFIKQNNKNFLVGKDIIMNLTRSLINVKEN
jgi:hypothetical protein